DIPPMKGGARVVNADPCQTLRAQTHDGSWWVARHHRGQQSVVGRHEIMPGGADYDDVARGPHPRVHDRHVHGPRWEVLEGPGQPETGLGGPMHDDFVG